MKIYIFLFLISALIISCCRDNGNKENDEFLTPKISKDFLLYEKWFLDEAKSDIALDFNDDGNKSIDLKLQMDACELDNFYIFEQFQPDLVVINDGNNICADFDDNYGAFVFDYSLLIDSRKLSITLPPFKLLGGFNDVYFLNNIKFLISNDTNYKLIKGVFQTTIDGQFVNINYKLRANANNRP